MRVAPARDVCRGHNDVRTGASCKADQSPAGTGSGIPPTELARRAADRSARRAFFRSKSMYRAGVSVSTKKVELSRPPINAYPRAFQIFASAVSLNRTSGSNPSTVVAVDGQNWTEPDTVDLPGFPDEVYVGVASAYSGTEPSLATVCDLETQRPVEFLRGDGDGSGVVDVTDPIFSLTNQFLGGPPPPDPGPTVCGPDPTDDGLDCLEYPQENC